VDYLDSGSLALQYNRHRYLSQSLGRWTSEDPLGTDPAGEMSYNLFDTTRQYRAELLLYGYAQASPVRNGDSLGTLAGNATPTILLYTWLHRGGEYLPMDGVINQLYNVTSQELGGSELSPRMLGPDSAWSQRVAGSKDIQNNLLGHYLDPELEEDVWSHGNLMSMCLNETWSTGKRQLGVYTYGTTGGDDHEKPDLFTMQFMASESLNANLGSGSNGKSPGDRNYSKVYYTASCSGSTDCCCSGGFFGYKVSCKVRVQIWDRYQTETYGVFKGKGYWNVTNFDWDFGPKDYKIPCRN
jgi:RHS repeat-associated protein